MLLEFHESHLGTAESPLAFTTTGSGARPVWDRYLSLDGKPAFHLGNLCNTCTFLFERLEGATRKVAVQAASEQLAAGITNLQSPVVQLCADALPVGDYAVCLIKSAVELVSPGDTNDYFANEQVSLWGVDPFWDMPHHPHTQYFRLGSRPIGNDARLFEFVVPMQPRRWLQPATLDHYTRRFKEGSCPTAVAISVLDRKGPSAGDADAAITEHWYLTHFLLDGHHKLFAAAAQPKPVSLLSFLALSVGTATREDALAALEVMRMAPPPPATPPSRERVDSSATPTEPILEPHPPVLPPGRITSIPKLLLQIRQRPGLYLTQPSALALGTFLAGIAYAEEMHQIPADRHRGGFPFAEFERWVARAMNPQGGMYNPFSIAHRQAESEEAGLALWFGWYDAFCEGIGVG